MLVYGEQEACLVQEILFPTLMSGYESLDYIDRHRLKEMKAMEKSYLHSLIRIKSIDILKTEDEEKT